MSPSIAEVAGRHIYRMLDRVGAILTGNRCKKRHEIVKSAETEVSIGFRRPNHVSAGQMCCAALDFVSDPSFECSKVTIAI